MERRNIQSGVPHVPIEIFLSFDASTALVTDSPLQVCASCSLLVVDPADTHHLKI